MKIPARFFDSAVKHLSAEGVIAEAGATVHLPGHQVKLTPEQQKKIDVYIKALSSNPFSPPPESDR